MPTPAVVMRYDFASSSRLTRAERTAAGGVRVRAVIARAGVLEYPHGRELLPPDELTRADSLRSLRDAPITIYHPAPDHNGSQVVRPETYRHLAVGHVSGDPRVQGDELVAEVVIMDAEAIRRVDAGELIEVSAGYGVQTIPRPGSWRGERYDAVQRGREYNHVALLPPGGGRAGPTVALRFDSRGRPARPIDHTAGREPPPDLRTAYKRK